MPLAHLQYCNVCPWLRTDCRTFTKPSWVRVEVCDVEEVRICETLCDESCLGLASRWHAVVWLPDTSPKSTWFLSKVCHSVSMLFKNSRLSACVNWLIFIYLLALPHLSCTRRHSKKCLFRDPTLRLITTHFCWLRQRNICSDLIIFRFHIK